MISAAFGAGYTTSEINHPIEIQTQAFDSFSYKASNEVQPMMREVLTNPTEENLRRANNKLKISYTNWAYRENGNNKQLFNEYLTACEKAIDEKQAGHDITVEIKEVNRLYKKLNP
jgi:hypothetical protein